MSGQHKQATELRRKNDDYYAEINIAHGLQTSKPFNKLNLIQMNSTELHNKCGSNLRVSWETDPQYVNFVTKTWKTSPYVKLPY
jgi:hypothetical protein